MGEGEAMLAACIPEDKIYGSWLSATKGILVCRLLARWNTVHGWTVFLARARARTFVNGTVSI